MSDEYTLCPGIDHRGQPCGSLVKIWGETGVYYCCHPCWETTWQPTALLLQGEFTRSSADFHSDQCDVRQKARHGQEVVTGRDWQIMGKVPDVT